MRPAPAGPAKAHAAGAPVGRYTVGLAGPEDEPAIRALLREPMDGDVRISLEREPHSGLAAAVEGDRHVTMVVKDADGRVVATGSRSVRTVWLDGERARLGYLGRLRRERATTGAAGALLRAGFATLAETREPDELPFDLTSIAADNLRARRLLERGLHGLPRYRPLGELVTCLVPTRGPMPRRLASRVRRRVLPLVLPGGTRVAEVAACLARNLARCQLAPVWTAADLSGAPLCRGLAAADLRVVAAGGEVRGCAALWDQRAFKQTRIRGYSPRIAGMRPLLDPVLRLTGRSPLPPVGSTLAMAHLSHVAVDEDDPDALLALIADARESARARGVDWLATGFVEGHPLLAPLLDATRPRTYRTVLYAVGWSPDAPLPALDRRRLHVEAATL